MKPDIKRIIRNCVVDVDNANWNACADSEHEKMGVVTSALWNGVYKLIYADTMESVLSHNSLHNSINEVMNDE